MDTTTRTNMDINFLILLPHAEVKSNRERLEAFLNDRFPDHRFGVSSDMADLINDKGYCVMPIRNTRPAPDGKDGAFHMSPFPPDWLMSEISAAVEDYKAGTVARPN